MIDEHRPRLVYLVPSFGNPSGAMLSLERRRRILEIGAAHPHAHRRRRPYCELFFDKAPPPSMLALSEHSAWQPRLDRALRQLQQDSLSRACASAG
jgi:2-aminoadipate transaminase